MNRTTPSSGHRPRVLLLSPFLYGEKAGNGGAVLCWAQLRQLAQHADLAFLGFSGVDEPAAESAHRASLALQCERVADVPLRINKPSVLKARLGSLSLANPELATLCRQPQMEQALREAIGSFRPDVVWIQFPQMAQYVECCGEVPAVMDVQDAYTLSGFRQAQRRPGLRRWLDWVCWARYEARHYARFASVLTLSQQDAQVLQAMNPAVPAVCLGVPLGQARGSTVSPVPGRVGFAGSFGHPPNVEGLGWFLTEVWPHVMAQRSDARFVVAGRNPPAALVARAGAGVEFAGFVPDIFDFYAANTVTAVPLVSGGGVKIKTVEAMLAGSALVSTRIGAEGTECVTDVHALVEDDPRAFAQAVLRVLDSEALRARLSNTAFAHAEAIFSSDAWRGRAATLIDRLLEARHVR